MLPAQYTCARAACTCQCTHIYAHGTNSSSHENVSTRALARHTHARTRTSARHERASTSVWYALTRTPVRHPRARASTHAHVSSVSQTCMHALQRQTHARTRTTACNATATHTPAFNEGHARDLKASVTRASMRACHTQPRERDAHEHVCDAHAHASVARACEQRGTHEHGSASHASA